MASKPTQRSLKELRSRGLLVEVTEHWNAYTKRRHDLFNFADMVALGETITAVQTTSGSNVSARIAKITQDEIVAPKAKAWLAAGGKILVHGWAKRGGKGQPKVWTLREVTITPADFPDK